MQTFVVEIQVVIVGDRRESYMVRSDEIKPIIQDCFNIDRRVQRLTNLALQDLVRGLGFVFNWEDR